MPNWNDGRAFDWSDVRSLSVDQDTQAMLGCVLWLWSIARDPAHPARAICVDFFNELNDDVRSLLEEVELQEHAN